MAGRRGRQVKKESNSRVGVSLLLPGPCLSPWGSPTLPRSSTRAVSPCPSSAAAAPVSSSPQPCRAWPGVPQSQACPCSHFLAWPCPIPSPRQCLLRGAGTALVPPTALLWGSGTGTGPGCSCPAAREKSRSPPSPECPQPPW